VQDRRARLPGPRGLHRRLGERPEHRAEEGDRDDRRDGADAGPARRADEVPAMLEPVAQPLAEAARLPGDHRRVGGAPGLDERRAGVAHLEGLAGAENVVVRIAAAREPDAAGKDGHLAAAGTERDDMAGRQGAYRLGVDRAQERGGGLLRIHHGHPCID